MLWEDTFKTIKCCINVMRELSIGRWDWIRDQNMGRLKSRLRIYFEGRRELSRVFRTGESHDE